MIILKNWTAKRSGATITIKHESGVISCIREITVFDGRVVAVSLDGKRYHLGIEA
jgi:hypothetical protein